MSAISCTKYSPSRVSERLRHLLDHPIHSDFTFIIEEDGSSIPVHKLIVALASPVLDRMAYGSDGFSPMDVVIVDAISRESFMEILRFIYTDTIDIHDENVFEILQKANYFGLTGIESKCVKYLDKKLSSSTVPWIYHQLFHSCTSTRLLEKCLLYIRINPLAFFASEYFDKISVDEFKSILEMDAINCTEIDLFRAMIQLSKAHCINSGIEVTPANQRNVLKGAEKLLRLETLTECEFGFECLEIQKDFYSREEIEMIRAHIRKYPVPIVTKRKWYTHRDAVWIRHHEPTTLPSSVFHFGNMQFVYRCIDNSKNPRVSDNVRQICSYMSYLDVLCGSGYEWRLSVNGNIPFGAVPVSEISQEKPVFISRALIDSKWRVGYATLDGIMQYIVESNRCPPLTNRNNLVTVTVFEVLVATNNVKNPFNGPGAPDDAICIGVDESNHKKYLGRSWFHNHLLPTNLVLKRTFVHADVFYEGAEQKPDNFDFVRMDPGTYCWKADIDGGVPENAVVAGYTSLREPLYFGRIGQDGNCFLHGTIQPSLNCLVVQSRGQEFRFRAYEVLSHVVS